MENIDSIVSMATDGSASDSQNSYSGSIAHFVDENSFLQRKVLSLRYT